MGDTYKLGDLIIDGDLMVLDCFKVLNDLYKLCIFDYALFGDYRFVVIDDFGVLMFEYIS